MSNIIYSILPNPVREIVYIHPDVSVQQCVEVMSRHHIGALVVTDDQNLLGIVSERDIINGLLVYGEGLLKRPASDILWANEMVLKPTDTVETAMAVMTETKRRHILVGEAGKILTILSIGDLLFSILKNKTAEIQQLEKYIQKTY